MKNIVRPSLAHAAGQRGRAAEGFLRLSYGYADAAELAEAADRLRRFVAET